MLAASPQINVTYRFFSNHAYAVQYRHFCIMGASPLYKKIYKYLKKLCILWLVSIKKIILNTRNIVKKISLYHRYIKEKNIKK
jgi:hypothetical protein